MPRLLTLADVLARCKQLSAQNRAKLKAYIVEEENRVEVSTLNSRMDALLALGQHLGKRPWLKALRGDVIHVISTHLSQQGAHMRSKPAAGKPLADSTRYQWSLHMRKFYQWLMDTDDTPPQFKRLPFEKAKAMAGRILEMALSPQEIKRLLGGARCKRDKAIIAVALEGGFRASEEAALRLDLMEDRNHGYWLTLDPNEPLLKTGPRDVAVPIIAAKRFVDDWIGDHPRSHESKAPLFVSLSNRCYGKRMTGPSIAAVIARCARRAGLRKVHHHMLRHSSATLKVAKGMQPEAIRLTHGWADLTMLSHYTHAKPHFENMVLQVHGLETEEPQLVDIIGSLPCLLCGKGMHIGDQECQSCGVTNADALASQHSIRRRDNAVAYVAFDLATALGWKAPPKGGEQAALAFLQERHKQQGGLGTGDGFVRWCLKQWAKHCEVQ